jgi:hypothetical protein
MFIRKNRLSWYLNLWSFEGMAGLITPRVKDVRGEVFTDFSEGKMEELEAFTNNITMYTFFTKPLLFLAYVNDIGRNIRSTIRLFADDCIICRKIINNKAIEKLQIDLNRLGE